MKNKTGKKLGRPRKARNWSPQLLNERAREYFDRCDARTKTIFTKNGPAKLPNPEPYSIEGLCVYLDVTRSQFDSWRKQDSDLGRRAQKIHLRITANRVTGALDGSQNAAFAQFMLRNNNPENYHDKVEVQNNLPDQVVQLLEMSIGKWQPR